MLIRRICILKLGTRAERFNEEGFCKSRSGIRAIAEKKQKTPEGVFCFVGGAEGNRRFAPPESVGLINE
jgi:hypothetical protein